jgi:hypothetical protein
VEVISPRQWISRLLTLPKGSIRPIAKTSTPPAWLIPSLRVFAALWENLIAKGCLYLRVKKNGVKHASQTTSCEITKNH